MTTLNFLLAHAVARTLQPGDEIVVTELDHDANVSPWLLIAADHELVVRHAPIRPGDVTLDHDALEALIGERTRVVAFTLASNAVGSVTDPARIAAAAHARRRAGLGGCRAPRAAPAPARRASGASTCCSARPTSSSARIWASRRSAPTWPRRCRPTACGRRPRRRPGTASRPAPSRTRRSPGTVAAIDYLRSLGDGSLDLAFERIRAHEDALARRFLGALPSRSSCTASAASRAARPPSASTSPAARRARWPSGWASAGCTSGTATTTRSSRCARSGWRTAAGRFAPVPALHVGGRGGPAAGRARAAL